MMSATKTPAPVIRPFPKFAALDGCHCISSSLARIYHQAGYPLSEEMILGLGAGMGFVYWRMLFGSEDSVFVGGRGNLKHFYQDLGRRTGVVIDEKRTASAVKAERDLLRILTDRKPVMMGGDMGMLPWFDLPEDYHFGGHTFVACGFDGGGSVLCSDIEQRAAGVKKGFFAPISLAQLRRARSSPFKPFPPKNLWLEFDFSGFHKPRKEDIFDSIRQTIDAALRPPIKNFGVRGMRHTADQLLEWPKQFNDRVLRMTLFNLYIFIEVGGTGGGCFRPMYARFLEEAARITRNRALHDAAEQFKHIGEGFTRVGLMFKDVAHVKNLTERVTAASRRFRELADQEERACSFIEAHI